MGTGTKIAIGCGVAVILGIVGVAAVMFGGAYWIKGKAEEMTGNEERIEELKRKANATPFNAPSDGVLQEDRLLKFLEIRKRVYSVYEKDKVALEAMGKKEKADFSDLTKGFSVINEVRMAQAQALSDLGMSEEEYRFFVEQVYKTLWAAEVAKATGGKSISEAAGAAYDQAAKEMADASRRAAEAEDEAEERAEEAGTDAERRAARDAEEKLEEGRKEIDKGLEDLKKQAGEVRESAKELDVPPANIALFRKYEAEIKKYAMGGLEWVGL